MGSQAGLSGAGCRNTTPRGVVQKENKVALSSCREGVQYAVLRIPFEEFLSKGVWWMPRLKKAMKDAV